MWILVCYSVQALVWLWCAFSVLTFEDSQNLILRQSRYSMKSVEVI